MFRVETYGSHPSQLSTGGFMVWIALFSRLLGLSRLLQYKNPAKPCVIEHALYI